MSQRISDSPHIHYVFMRFPAPAEAFARVELRGLRDAGCRISVSTLRAPQRGDRALLREHGLDDMAVSYAGPGKWLAGLAAIARRPGQAWQVVREVFPALTGRWTDMMIACVLLPRAFGIATEVREIRADHVHLFWGHYPSLVGLAMGALGARCSLSMSLGAYDLVKQSPLSRLLARRVPVLTHARVNVEPISEFTGVPRDSIKVVYRGIEITGAPDSAVRADEPRVLVAERLVPDKRTIDSLRVFARVRERVPHAVLVILGDGPSRRKLEAWARRAGLQDCVVFRGRVSHDQVQEEMGRARVLLSMTRSPGERLPNAVKEAMCRECAVLVTRSPGIDELVEEGESGYIVEPGAIDQAAERLTELLADAGRATSLGRRGRRRILERFDVADTTQQRLTCWVAAGEPGRAQVN